MEPDVSQKQQFLYREIIEGGFSPEDFQEFLENENPKAGMNLGLWKMAELEAATKKFIQMTQAENSEEKTVHSESSIPNDISQ